MIFDLSRLEIFIHWVTKQDRSVTGKGPGTDKLETYLIINKWNFKFPLFIRNTQFSLLIFN
jgi:hypothetical protein